MRTGFLRFLSRCVQSVWSVWRLRVLRGWTIRTRRGSTDGLPTATGAAPTLILRPTVQIGEQPVRYLLFYLEPDYGFERLELRIDTKKERPVWEISLDGVSIASYVHYPHEVVRQIELRAPVLIEGQKGGMILVPRSHGLFYRAVVYEPPAILLERTSGSVWVLSRDRFLAKELWDQFCARFLLQNGSELNRNPSSS